MLFQRKQTPQKLVEKGDKYFTQKKYKKALEKYQRANELDPDNKSVYEKMIAAHLEVKDEWTDLDFANSVSWTMKKQELENPSLKRIHARMTPEWDEINSLIKTLLLAGNEEDESQTINHILSHGEKALYPLLEFVLGIKKINPLKPLS